jgi:hypothetical protein
MSLLDAIVDNVGNSSDASIREFAAKCLAEFLKWAIIHASKKVGKIAILLQVLLNFLQKATGDESI